MHLKEQFHVNCFGHPFLIFPITNFGALFLLA
uniref:Uncharacterized protein n=1 Tax=Rhizophora mucronata TaxID=61149 RepID=A0A2P2JBQ7_RHIMU